MPRSPFDALSYLVPFSQVGLYEGNPSTGVVVPPPPPPPPPLLPPLGQQAQVPGSRRIIDAYSDPDKPPPFPPAEGKRWVRTKPYKMGQDPETLSDIYGIWTEENIPDENESLRLELSQNRFDYQKAKDAADAARLAGKDAAYVKRLDDLANLAQRKLELSQKKQEAAILAATEKQALATRKFDVTRNPQTGRLYSEERLERKDIDERAEKSWETGREFAERQRSFNEQQQQTQKGFEQQAKDFNEYLFKQWISGTPTEQPTFAQWLARKPVAGNPWWYDLPGGMDMAERQRLAWEKAGRPNPFGGTGTSLPVTGPLQTQLIGAPGNQRIPYPVTQPYKPSEPFPEAPESYAQWGRPGFKSLPEARASGLFDPGKLAFGVAERITGSGQLPGGGWMGGSREAEIKIRADAEQAKKLQEAEQNALSSWDRMVRRARSSPYPGFRP